MMQMTVIGVIITIIDQFIKNIITSQMIVGESIPVIPSTFYITYVENTGAAWSILEGNRYFLVCISFLAIFAIYYFCIKGKHLTTLKIYSFGVLFGGIIGNLIDRIIHGYVIDFISVYIGSYAFPIFNIADMAIVIGACISIYILYKEEHDAGKSKRK